MDESTVERLLRKQLEEDRGGRPLTGRARTTQRSVEDYLKAGVRPRWMERLTEIERGTRGERRRLERAHRALSAKHAGDPAGFARAWHAFAAAQRFDHLNQLIRQHNEWYPIERDLPMDLRTRDYVLINGRSYRREPLSPQWVLERFPVP